MQTNMSGESSLPIEIAFGQSGERESARYVSATTVLEEALDQGRWIGLYWSASGQVQRENVTSGLPTLDPLRYPLHTFELEVDGQSLHNRWNWGGASQRSARRGTVEAVVDLHHQVRPITLKVVTRLDGSPVLARYLEITNRGSVPAALSVVSPFAGLLWNMEPPAWFPSSWRINRPNPSFDAERQSPFMLGYFYAHTQGEEGEFVWTPIPSETFRLDHSLTGRAFAWPYFIVRNNATGEVFFMGLAWSGSYQAEFRHPRQDILLFRMGPKAPAPLRIIAPGETVISPEIHLGPLHCDMDQAVAQWHQHVRASVVPPRPLGKEMYTVAGRVVEEPDAWILREIDIAAEMGVEAFMVDAGWYGDTFGDWPVLRGDWEEGSWLPGGMTGIRERAHQKGLLFGLWHEAEALTLASQTGREHPDWFLRTDNGRLCASTLDLANPEAARFLEETVVRLIRDHKLDFYKLDFNVDVGEGGQTLRDAYAESEFWRHNETLYRTYDRILQEFPEVCLENCASGGGRNDLGMLSRFHYACESDWSLFPYSIRAINSLTLFLPPEAVCYYHNHVPVAHQRADLATHLRVTLFVVPVFVGFGAQDADRSTDYFRLTKRYIALHRGFCRPVLANHPVVYHHTPELGLFSPAEWCVLEYAAQDRSRVYAGLFRLGNDAGANEYLFHPRGLDLACDYEVTLDNSNQVFRVSGRELMCHGIRVHLDRPLTSELLLFSAVKGTP